MIVRVSRRGVSTGRANSLYQCALPNIRATSPHNLANGRMMMTTEYERRGLRFLLVLSSSGFLYL